MGAPADLTRCHHLCVGRSFEELIEEAQAAPIEGWDFSWLAGRATEERPSWRYSEIVAERITSVSTMLDLQSGGGEMLANLPRMPALLVATEGYGPNVVIAKRLLGARGAYIVASEDDLLPFASEAFDLVTSRHPVATWWREIARVLRPGGTYLSQQVGPHSVRELSEYMLGPLPPDSTGNHGMPSRQHSRRDCRSKTFAKNACKRSSMTWVRLSTSSAS